MFFYGTKKHYNQYSEHLKQIFGVKVYKVTIDAGFSCPNRENNNKGCIFCDESGSFSQGMQYVGTSVTQIIIDVAVANGNIMITKQ